MKGSRPLWLLKDQSSVIFLWQSCFFYFTLQNLAEKATRNKNGGYVSNEAIYNIIVEALTEERMLDNVDISKKELDR